MIEEEPLMSKVAAEANAPLLSSPGHHSASRIQEEDTKENLDSQYNSAKEN